MSGGFDDFLRAAKQSFTNFAHSNAGKVVGEESLRFALQKALPHLANYIQKESRKIWEWFKQNF